MDLKAIFPNNNKITKKKKTEFFPSCSKRESLGFYASKCISLKVFVVKHNRSSTTTEAYQSSSKGDRVEEFSKCYGKLLR
jgi:hypothetical protein